jgi:hypothetical protein
MTAQSERYYIQKISKELVAAWEKIDSPPDHRKKELMDY